MYSCGITVYDLCHVGHARMLVAFDVIARHLRASGFEVTYVRNVTDVDDKIIRRAEAEKRSAAEVARDFTEKMNEDMRALNVLPADHEPRATEHIAEVIEIIERLEKNGLAYAAARRRLLLGARVPALRPAVEAKHRRSALRRAHRGRRAQAQPARLRALEGRQAGRAVLGEPVGQRAPRLAHRVLGDGAPLPGRAVRHPRRRRRPRSSRTTRTRSPSPRARSATASSRATGSTPGWSTSAARRCPSRWATS